MTARSGRSGRSAGEATAHLGHVYRKAVGQGLPVELGDGRPLSHRLGQEFTDEMGQREPALDRHGVETRGEVAS